MAAEQKQETLNDLVFSFQSINHRSFYSAYPQWTDLRGEMKINENQHTDH